MNGKGTGRTEEEIIAFWKNQQDKHDKYVAIRKEKLAKNLKELETNPNTGYTRRRYEELMLEEKEELKNDNDVWNHNNGNRRTDIRILMEEKEEKEKSEKMELRAFMGTWSNKN